MRKLLTLRSPWTKRLLVLVSMAAVAGAAGAYVARARLPEQIAEGRALFVHEWTAGDPLAGEGDGLGPVFNASSCVACHFQGGVGGAGPNERNVTAFEVLPNVRDEFLISGVVHASATRADLQETATQLRRRYPTVPGLMRIRGGCTYQEPDFDPLHFQSINTPPLFGAGLIDDISSRAIRSNVNWRRASNMSNEVLYGDFDGTSAGRVRILEDGRVGRFGWKAQFATLEEFVAAACAVEVGLTNPYRAQDAPGEHAPDEEAELDMTRRQFKSLVAYCRHLDAPVQARPRSPREAEQVAQGKHLFAEIGCADCHTPDLGGVQGIYSDLALHRVEDPDRREYRDEPQVPLPSHLPNADEWKTPPLWGVADSAPYWHDGSAHTLEEAIGRHHGQADLVRKRFQGELDKEEREAVVAFLSSLRAPQTTGDEFPVAASSDP